MVWNFPFTISAIRQNILTNRALKIKILFVFSLNVRNKIYIFNTYYCPSHLLFTLLTYIIHPSLKISLNFHFFLLQDSLTRTQPFYSKTLEYYNCLQCYLPFSHKLYFYASMYTLTDSLERIILQCINNTKLSLFKFSIR